jgi:hypothetical protein
VWPVLLQDAWAAMLHPPPGQQQAPRTLGQTLGKHVPPGVKGNPEAHCAAVPTEQPPE